MLLREKQTDKFLAVRARGAEILGAQVVLLLAGDFKLDRHYLQGKRIVVGLLVMLRWILQVYLER